MLAKRHGLQVFLHAGGNPGLPRRRKGRGALHPVPQPWRDVPEADHPDAPYAVRLKAPRDGETVIEDAVQGRVTFRNDQLDDMILLRSDGTPTYMLAVVVDDHDMGVTHAIRGDDHLNNAARQAQIYRAMGWAEPVWAHIPLIHGPDGKKLSKRHGATGVMEYAAMGYPAAAMRNYLARLGWSHGDDELFTDARRWNGSTSGHRQGPGPARHEETRQRRVLAYRADGGRRPGAEVADFRALTGAPALSQAQKDGLWLRCIASRIARAPCPICSKRPSSYWPNGPSSRMRNPPRRWTMYPVVYCQN
jgi:glutamyl-tRNA synthetase